MLWKLLRARLWMLRHRWQGLTPRQRALALGLLWCTSAGGVWAYGRVVATIREAGNLFSLAGIVPGGLMILFFMSLISLADTLRRLYLHSDMALLLIAPVSPHTLYGAKLIECSQSLWLPAVLIGVVLVAVGQAQGAPVLYYPLVVALILGLVTLLTALGMILVIVFAHILPPNRIRGWLPVLLAVASLGGILLQQALMSQSWIWMPLLAGLDTAAGDAIQMLAAAGTCLGAAGLITLAGYGLFHAAFYQSWTDLQGGSTAPRRRHSGLAALITRRVPTPTGVILTKDVTLLFREPDQLVGLAIVPLIMIVLLFPLISDSGALRVLTFWLLLLYGGMFGLNSVQGTGLAAWAREGRNFWLLRIAPFSLRAAFRAKFWGQWLPVGSVWAVAYLLTGIVAGLPAWQTGLLITTSSLGLAVGTVVTLSLGAIGTDPDRENEGQRVSSLYAWLGLGLTALFVGLSLMVMVLLMPHLAPGSELVRTSITVLLAVAPSADWILGTEGLIVAALAMLTQVLYLLGVHRLWMAGIRHLQTCEIA